MSSLRRVKITECLFPLKEKEDIRIWNILEGTLVNAGPARTPGSFSDVAPGTFWEWVFLLCDWVLGGSGWSHIIGFSVTHTSMPQLKRKSKVIRNLLLKDHLQLKSTVLSFASWGLLFRKYFPGSHEMLIYKQYPRDKECLNTLSLWFKGLFYVKECKMR